MSFLGRITRIHVLAAGCVAFIAVALAFMMLAIQPRLNDLRNTRRQVTSQKETAAKLQSSLTQLAQAQATYVDTKARFDAILAKQPPLSTDPIQGAFDLWREYGPTGTGTVLWKWFTSHGYDISGIAVPGPPMPPVSLPPMIAIGMSLQLHAKTFGEVLKFLDSTSDVPRLMLISSVTSISGHPPDLQVPLPATFFIITRNAPGGAPAPTAVAAGMPAIGAAAAPTSTGGGGIGPRGLRVAPENPADE